MGVRDVAAFVRARGAKRFVQECLYRASNAYYERRFGVQTTRTVRLADVGIRDQDAHDSTPLGYRSFFTIVKALPIDPRSSVFIDFGAGKGRAVCAAASLPFKRVIGLELSDVLVAALKQNIDRMQRTQATTVECVLTDATAFDIPPDASLLYFYNPFTGETLRRVVSNIQASWERHPRKIHVVFFNDDHFAKVIEGQTWIRKTHEDHFYPGVACGVYETV